MTYKGVVAELKKAKNIAIFGHSDPDPDAYGAMFAMRELCRQLGKNAEIFAVKNADGYLDDLFPLEELKTDFKASNFDLVVMVDMHMFKRLAKIFVDEAKQAENVLVLDHHTITGEEALVSKNYVVDSKKAATCELLAEIMLENGLEISDTMATYLWIGLVGDTGRFLHGNTDVDVFRIAIKLMECRAHVQEVYDKMFRSVPLKNIKLEKVYIDKIKLVANGCAGYVIFTLKDFERLGIDKEDVEQFTDMICTIKGVELSFCCFEVEKNIFRFSLRTNSKNCRDLAVSMGGGGHMCAAAFTTKGTARQMRKQISIWAEEILK